MNKEQIPKAWNFDTVHLNITIIIIIYYYILNINKTSHTRSKLFLAIYGLNSWVQTRLTPGLGLLAGVTGASGVATAVVTAAAGVLPAPCSFGCILGIFA